MGQGTARDPELVIIQLPRMGLDELMRGWSSDGQLYDALSAVAPLNMDLAWTRQDIERRASRVLLGRIAGEVEALPKDPESWQEHLPITTAARRQVSDRPIRPTNWATTARRYGWPPTAYVAHPRSRVQDETALQTLLWTARSLETTLRQVRPIAPALVEQVEGPVLAMLRVVSEDMEDIATNRPDRLDLRALAASGRPWSGLAAVAEAIVLAETDLELLAYELIQPDPDLEWRLFHLSVLGEVLASTRRLGGRVCWRAPLNASGSSGPQFEIELRNERWDLWFEAAGAAQHYGAVSPYRRATSGVVRNPRSIGADVMLCLPGQRSLTLECKWSPLGTYVGREGYHQAAAYAVEVRSGQGIQAWSFVVGPEELVPSTSSERLDWPGEPVVLGACSIRGLDGLVASLVSGAGDNTTS